ncbi:VOC family protein [Winogradskyella tangerina]|uniref:VOC family protein n=1 Tax=Winogradskyella tangerina TaxID=2023240 RepID=UPI000DBE4B54|nr:VOC family protein [Winogradskyella tangerina]
MKTPFHLALPCEDIDITKDFYVFTLGAKSGRSSDNWIDINLFGHQITFTKVGDFEFNYKNYRFGEHILPSFHFGVIVDTETWGKTYSRLLSKNLEVTTEATFLEHKIGEHLSFFITDPNGYKIELKSFKNINEIFET